MAKSYEILRARMSPERRAENDRATQKLLREMALQDLRESLDLSQAQVAEAQASQPTESQRDIYMSSLRGYVEALGGQLKLVASFPDREVVINPTETIQEAALTKLAA